MDQGNKTGSIHRERVQHVHVFLCVCLWTSCSCPAQRNPAGVVQRNTHPPYSPLMPPAGKRTSLPGHSAPSTPPFPTPLPWPRTPPSTARRSYLEQGGEVTRRGGEHADEEYDDLQPSAALPAPQPQTSSPLKPHRASPLFRNRTRVAPDASRNSNIAK